jgi:hypothetical protein
MPPIVDPAALDWLLASDEPAARWVALTQLLDRPPEDPDVEAAHRAVLADPGTRELVGRLGDWDDPPPLGGHNSPAYAPNLLSLLADMGVRAGDDPTVDGAVGALLHHHDEAGRLGSRATHRRIGPDPVVGALLCDSHAIVEVLIRFGRAKHPTVRQALDRMATDLAPTSQGPGWPCIPSNGFRGPGRKGDVCPQVTLEALRTLARLPAERRPLPPADLLATAKTALHVWTGRGTEKPYVFGHGIAFKTVKWPPYWYGVMWVLDTVGRYPELWRADAPAADPGDRRAVAELAACLIAYNLGPDGRVTPRSCYRGFEGFSFGQKKRPSPFATARVLAVLRPFGELAAEIEKVGVLGLGSSKGGGGTAIGPRPRDG